MRLRTCTLVLTAMVASTVASHSLARDDAPTTAPASQPTAGLSLISTFVGGEWRIDSKWIDGPPLKARATYEWGLGKKFIVGKTFVTKPDGTEYQRYENIFGIDNGRLTNFSFVFDGATHIIPMTVDGKTVRSEWFDGATSRQELTFDRLNEFTWKVWVQETTGGPWKAIVDGVWRREKL